MVYWSHHGALFPFFGSMNVEKASARNMSFLANILTTQKLQLYWLSYISLYFCKDYTFILMTELLTLVKKKVTKGK